MVPSSLSTIHTARVETICTAALSVETRGEGFFEITGEATRFLTDAKAREGTLFLFIRHTSASLVIQENADADVRTDLVTALRRLAPADAGWIHDAEGPDDMPGHVKSMLNGVSLGIPVAAGKMLLGTWQGIYVAEHRARPHTREVVLQFVGACGSISCPAQRGSRDPSEARRREEWWKGPPNCRALPPPRCAWSLSPVSREDE